MEIVGIKKIFLFELFFGLHSLKRCANAPAPQTRRVIPMKINWLLDAAVARGK